MILKNRFFERKLPIREAKSFYLFCEGNNREPQYLLYFKEIDSRINVEVIAAAPHDNNSPTGLYEKACKFMFASANHPIPKFELLERDEVWFIKKAYLSPKFRRKGFGFHPILDKKEVINHKFYSFTFLNSI